MPKHAVGARIVRVVQWRRDGRHGFAQDRRDHLDGGIPQPGKLFRAVEGLQDGLRGLASGSVHPDPAHLGCLRCDQGCGGLQHAGQAVVLGVADDDDGRLPSAETHRVVRGSRRLHQVRLGGQAGELAAGAEHQGEHFHRRARREGQLHQGGTEAIGGIAYALQGFRAAAFSSSASSSPPAR